MKKLTAIILSAIMLMSFNTYAQSDNYEQIVSNVKNLLNINEYDNFDCTEHSDKGRTFINISWSNKDNSDSVEVTCDTNGNIYNYWKFSDKEYGDDKSKVYTENECKETADAFLEKILGENYGNIKYVDYYMSYETYSYTYNIVSGNIPFSSDKINININKYTNSVMNINIPYYLFDIKTDDFSSAIGEEKAKEILKNKFDMVYITNYDYENEKYNIIPAYAPEYYYMDAITGDKFDSDFFYYDYGTTEAAGSINAKAMDNSSINLTEAEKNEINNFKTIIKPEDAVNKLNSLLGLNINAGDINYSYYKNKIEDKTYYDLNINYNKDFDLSASFDQDGRLISYNKFMDYEKNENTDKDILRQKAENIIKSNYPSLDFALRNENNERPTFNFDIYRNGIKSVDEGIRIEFNGNSELMYADFNLNNYIDYPPVNAVLTKDEAFDIGMKEYPPEMSYYAEMDNNTGIYNTYDIYNINATYAVNALTGDIISIDDGRPLSKNNNKINFYKDINDQWYADIVTKLLYMGYRFEGDIFDGDKALTLNDFEYFYNGANEILRYDTNYNSKEYSKDPDAPLTRYEFAEIFTDIMGYSKITDLDIYKAPYEDTDKGSVSIMKGLGLLDNDSTFNGDDIITRAEMANIVYKYVISM